MSCLVSGWKPSRGDALVPSPDHSHVSKADTQPATGSPQRGQPGYVKRPRNSFIIFRCEYVRLHRGTRPPTGDRYKRLSKRAAEAWTKLSKEERALYVQLSEQEKEEHARLYPDYVFKPRKQARRADNAAATTANRNARQQQVCAMMESQRSTSTHPALSSSQSPAPSIEFAISSPIHSIFDSGSSQSSSSSSYCPSLRSDSPTRDCTAQGPHLAYPMTPEECCSPFSSVFFNSDASSLVSALSESYIPDNDDASSWTQSLCTPMSTPLDTSPLFCSSSSSLANWSGGVDEATCLSPIWFGDSSPSPLCDSFVPSDIPSLNTVAVVGTDLYPPTSPSPPLSDCAYSDIYFSPNLLPAYPTEFCPSPSIFP